MRRFLTVLAWVAAYAVAASAPRAAFAQAQTPAQTQPQAQAQTPAPIQGPSFRTGVDVVSVDVAVVDRNGKPVEDLRAPEFTVKIDGEERRVVSAELVKVDVEAAKREVADKSETFYTSNLTPINGRMILIAIDQINIRPGTLQPILKAASAFLDHLSPLDQVGFIAYPEPGPRVNFTSDKLKLRLAMQGLIGQSERISVSTLNIGASEALALYDKRDQLILAQVVARECRGLAVDQRGQCERDIFTEASEIAIRLRQNAELSRVAIRDILTRLALLEGPKSLILISEGLALQDDDEVQAIVALAGRARTSINIMSVDLQRNDITITEAPPTQSQDRRIQLEGLEALAVLSRGALFHVVGTGENIFDRLASEISAYYLLGVEQRPSDAKGDRHRIDVSVRRQNVTIRSRQAFVLSPTLNAKRSAEDGLRDALTSPFPVSGLPVRVTTFAQQDPASSKVQLMIAAQVGQPGAQPAEFTVGFLVVDDQNKVVTSWGNKQTLSPAGKSANEPLAFLSGVAVEPGNYSLRFGVVDAEGRRGSVVRDVSAWKLTGEELAVGDLFVGTMTATGPGLSASVEPHLSSGTVAAYLELYSTSDATFDGTTVRLEIAETPDSPALATLPAQLAPGKQPSWRVATGVVGVRMIPPGRYVTRAVVTRGGKTVAALARPIVLEAGAAVGDAAPRIAAASVSFASSLPPFDRNAVLGREFVGPMLDAVEKRSPALKDAMVEARAGRYGAAALEALTSGDQAAASFLRGIDFYAKGQIDQAATQLQLAAGPRREFFPAAFYLGAAFAAVGRDRDAAGVWQIALGTEQRPSAVYVLVADARLRDGQAASAIDILKPAFDREPANDAVAMRLGMAYVIAGRHADAIPVLDAYLTRHPADQDYLFVAVTAHYEAARAGQGLSNVDRARLKKYGTAYKGPQRALVDKYLETLEVR
jgi:VWFA-related protein